MNISHTYMPTLPLTETISDYFQNSYQAAKAFVGRSIIILKNLPLEMQQNPHIAISTFLVANAAIFTLSNLFANWLDNRIDQEDLDSDQRTIKHLLLTGVVVGGSTLTTNILLSKLTRYSLSPLVFVAITTTAIGLRIILNKVNEQDTTHHELKHNKKAKLRVDSTIQKRAADTARKVVQQAKLKATQIVKEKEEAKKNAEAKPTKEAKKKASQEAELKTANEEPAYAPAMYTEEDLSLARQWTPKNSIKKEKKEYKKLKKEYSKAELAAHKQPDDEALKEKKFALGMRLVKDFRTLSNSKIA